MYLKSRFFVLALCAVLPAASHAETLCANNEVEFFSCKLRSDEKVVSLCASNDLSTTKGYLQYRFGTKEKVELTFPSDQTSRPAFVLTRKHDKKRELNSLGFSLGNNSYQLTSYRDRSPKGASEEADTIYVADERDTAGSERFVFMGECELPLGKPLDVQDVAKKTRLKVKTLAC